MDLGATVRKRYRGAKIMENAGPISRKLVHRCIIWIKTAHVGVKVSPSNRFRAHINKEVSFCGAGRTEIGRLKKKPILVRRKQVSGPTRETTCIKIDGETSHARFGCT